MDEKWMLELLDFPVSVSQEAGDPEALLVKAVEHLMETDFPRLCQLLYKVDVDEAVLKARLTSSDAPPAEIIARQLLERQKQKVALREKYTGSAADIPEEERW